MKNLFIWGISGVLFLALGAFGFWYFSNSQQSVSGVDSVNIDAIRPVDMRIDEIGQNYFIVSWNTKSEVSGYIRYGDTSTAVSLIAQDVSGTKPLKTHKVRVSNLFPGRKYFFWVMSDNIAFGKDGMSLEVLTLAE